MKMIIKLMYLNSVFLLLSKQFFLVIIFLFSSTLYAEEVKIATGINTDPPYVYGDLDIAAEYPGITIDIFKLIEEKSSITFSIEKQPWARVVRDVKENVLDGGFHFSFKEKRKSFVAYPIPKGETVPDPIYSISDRSYVLYRLQGDAVRWTGEEIINAANELVVVGAIRGSSITETIKELGYDLLEANTDKQLLKLLLHKRVDGIVGLANMLDAKIGTLDVEAKNKIEKTYPALQTKPYYVAFSKAFYRAKPDVAWEIWETIKQIRSSGEMTEIFKRYANR